MNECEAKAAAFKDAKGKYTYVNYELYYCRYYEESTASRKWNKQTARFEIKSKGPKPPAYSTFKDFLTEVGVEFVGFRC